MKIKYLIIQILLILVTFYSNGQKYFKFKENDTIKNDSIIIYEGEIYKKIDKNKILFDNKEVQIETKKVDNIGNNDINDMSESKLEYIKTSNDSLYIINVQSLINDGNKDTIRFIKRLYPKTDKDIILFSTRGKDSVKIEDCDAIVRLVIPNSPTLVYTKSEIQQYNETLSSGTPPSDKNIFDNNKSSQDKNKNSSKMLLIIIILMMIFVVLILIKIYKDISKLSGFSNNEGYSDDIEKLIQDSTNEISNQAKIVEANIINKINTLNKDEYQKIENLQRENESLKTKVTQLNNDTIRKEQYINSLKNELNKINEKNQKIENEYLKYSKKVILVDCLEPYAKIILEFYNYCQSGYNKVIEFFQRLNSLDSENSEIINTISQFLVKYYSNIPSKTIQWVGVINDIISSKTTVNIELIRSLEQITNNEEKIKEFKRIIFKDFLEGYTNANLILMEELSKLSKFTDNSNNIVKEIEHFFSRYKLEMLSKLKTIGLNFNYVPLFEHYEKYAAFTKLSNQPCSLPYKKVKNLPKDYILEIINFGFDNKETIVILA